MMGFGMGFGMVLVVLFWVALILLAVWLVKALFTRGGQPTVFIESRLQSAQEILNQRYARGEINREQYDLMKKDLEQ